MDALAKFSYEEQLGPFEKEWPFNNEPREVQMRALAKGFKKPGFAYFMRQRLGKTWTAYAEFTLLRHEELVDWMVVICPNSVKSEWWKAIADVDLATNVYVYDSNRKKSFETFMKKCKRGGVIVINYESVPAFMKNNYYALFDTWRTYIVADESTKIKEPRNKSTKACIMLAALCKYRRVLSGKPTANSQADIWAQLKFIGATYRNFYQHKLLFCSMGGYKGKQIQANQNTDLLRREMEPYCYIAEDKFIVGFEKVYEPLRKIEMSELQTAQYKKMESDLILELTEDVAITAPIALVKYLRLQQIGRGIAGDEDGIQHNTIPPEKNPAIDAVKDILESEITDKVIISCRFRLSIENLYDQLTKAGYKCLKFYGGMTTEEIIDTKAKFNNADLGYDILIGQESVLAYGHTLCGDRDDRPCDSVIFYENSFSLLNRSQIESRPEKMGRNKPISYYDIYTSDLDKEIIEALVRKEDASMALMGYARKFGILPNIAESA